MRVLSLDGGGVRGLYQIQVLKILEKEVGNLNDYFDLIIGTSVGAMIGSYIRLGYDMKKIEKGYLQNLTNTFHVIEDKKSIEIAESLNIFKFNDATLNRYRENMEETFLGEKIEKPFLSVSINISDKELKIFRVDKDSTIKDYIDSVMATTALPALFKPYEIDGKYYSDGGILYNDPSLLALSEALKVEKDASKIKILSIGTLTECSDNKDIYDKKNLKNMILEQVAKENKFLKYITEKSYEIEAINFIHTGSPMSYAYNYTTSFFDATNNGHYEVLKSIYGIFNAEDNYLRINHVVENRTNALKYLYEYSDMVKNDESLVVKLREWVNR